MQQDHQGKSHATSTPLPGILALQNFKLLDNSHLAQEFQLTIPALIFLGTLREPGASGYGRGRQARVSCLPQTVHPKL